MNELAEKISDLQKALDSALDKIGIGKLESKVNELTAQSQSSDFWSDSIKAQKTMKELAELQARLQPWKELKATVEDLAELASLKDPQLTAGLEEQCASAVKQFDKLKDELKFSGIYDDRSALMMIHAGAGGTDAQDWTQMLERMYIRWAEQHGMRVEVIERSTGEEAGIKSVTLEFGGPFVFGKLKGEHGVHRLVRLSPFNADNLRQTSFAKVEILPKIEQPEDAVIDEKDLKVDVYRSGGHGGQSVNTTDSAVRITHIPTGISVSIQNERSQLQNKETAMTILRSRLVQLQLEQHKERLDQIKGPNQSAEWGNQIRSYVLHPYKQVKDLRTRHETSDPQAVLDGKIDDFITAYLEHSLATKA